MEKNEEVLVISREILNSLGSFQGFCGKESIDLSVILDRRNQMFVLREDAEEDTSLKQLIPYCILTYNGKYLRYTRGSSGGEGRLHAKTSLGIGGHINPIDEVADKDVYTAGLLREIQEELVLEGKTKITTLGVINDDSNSVGEVHLGVVHLIELDNDNVSANEDCMCDLKFLTKEELLEEEASLESWSSIVLNELK